MKFTTATLCAGAAALAAAAPSKTINRRADFCDQWGSVETGSYIVYNNLWGQANADSGSQCTGVDSLSGDTLAWHTSWTWTGGAGQVKSYANVVLNNIEQKQLSAISSIPSTWKWTYAGSDLVADVAYDLFTSSTAGGDEEYEIMIWLAALGGAGPISSTGSKIATTTLGGVSFDLYKGPNGQMTVFSFVASSEAQSFSADLMDFVDYLTTNQGLPTSQYIKSIGAGTEPFSGNDAVLTTSAFSVSMS
ncbi:Xyloglucan-specific endo-beta- -glucanase a protein [Lasiodiplodia theobromae]|uniref:Xyloglucan-specific endo-beta- -glucanase a protein n=1 Tax=Lasiodiplodia theobromae TaxID=45133 RepID=UPI0015C2F115|nr:Xyloglucan-specific endo-beta- -glucanase a protein [Lasiodiplodia theobromae]KAF4540151.1 Xyloglucan-specific endo-beta- -glucanase a protein [Lasiodiplodia theobromae]